MFDHMKGQQQPTEDAAPLADVIPPRIRHLRQS
jgi:hypothetical protein